MLELSGLEPSVLGAVAVALGLVGSVALAVLILGEEPSAVQLLGVAVILAGILLATLKMPAPKGARVGPFGADPIPGAVTPGGGLDTEVSSH